MPVCMFVSVARYIALVALGLMNAVAVVRHPVSAFLIRYDGPYGLVSGYRY